MKKITKEITELEFITDVAKDCLANLSDEDKEYLMKHPFELDYHFSYGLYIRNKYIHNTDFSEATFCPDPDYMSGDILKMIFSMVASDYKYNDSFTIYIFDNSQYIELREKYFKEFGEYPADIADKYRDNFNIVYDEMINQPYPEDDDKEMEIVEQITTRSKKLIDPFLKELHELLD